MKAIMRAGPGYASRIQFWEGTFSRNGRASKDRLRAREKARVLGIDAEAMIDQSAAGKKRIEDHLSRRLATFDPARDARTRDRLRGTNARCEIDEITLAALLAHDVNPLELALQASLFPHLLIVEGGPASGRQTGFKIATGYRDMPERLVLDVPIAKSITWRESGSLAIRGTLVGETLCQAMAGQPIESLVEHPLLSGRGIKIVRMSSSGSTAVAHTDYQSRRIALLSCGEGARKAA